MIIISSSGRPLSSSQTMNLNLLRFALFSPYSKLPMMQTSFPHIIIGHCFYPCFYAPFGALSVCALCKGILCFYALVGAISCMATSLEGNFCVCKGILCFFALVGAISRAISVCARALYVSMLLCVQGQFNICVQGHSMLLFGAISM